MRNSFLLSVGMKRAWKRSAHGRATWYVSNHMLCVVCIVFLLTLQQLLQVWKLGDYFDSTCKRGWSAQERKSYTGWWGRPVVEDTCFLVSDECKKQHKLYEFQMCTLGRESIFPSCV
jgi:hypothetical protein